MSGFKKIALIVFAVIILATIYLYYNMSLPDLPDASHAVADLSDGPTGKVHIKSKSPYNMSVLLNDLENAPDIALPAILTLPDNANAENPVPAMVIIHGSGGIAEGREFEYAKLLAENGIASLVLDYYQARGVDADTNYMKKVMSVTEVDLIVDAFSSLKVLSTHPAIDSEKIGIMGFSYGGMAARYALNQQMKDLLAPDVIPFAAHVDFYGPCHQSLITNAVTGAPYLSLRGGKDASNDLAVCKDVEVVIQNNGSSVETHIYPDAGHAWENSMELKLNEEAPYISGCHFGFTKDGFATVNGGVNIDDEPELDDNRDMRALKRMNIQASAKGCIKYGYIMGQDINTRDDAYIRLLAFLKKTFSLAN